MKRIIVGLLIALFSFSALVAQPALAQSENPPKGPIGEVRGTIVNRNSGKTVDQSLDVMLHVLDKDYAEKDMRHAQSAPDGTFVFADVPFDEDLQFAVMAIYDEVTYVSDVVASDMTSLGIAIEVPVYDSTSDLTNIQVDQMHVLFDFAEDGLETKEIYVFSNGGEHTVKNAYQLDGNQFATLEFPLPEDADYIFFKPEDKDRFVKLSGRFADTYPILPGTESSQIMVSYLVPYSNERDYTYTAAINIARINFVVPDEVDISLKGSGLVGPETMDLQNGGSYLVYSYSALDAGQTMSVSISGTSPEASSNQKSNTLIAMGAAFLGFVVLGVGIWWWRRPDDADEETAESPDTEMDFDQAINEIAYLDQAHEKGEIDEQEYHESREVLRKKAKALMDHNK